MSAVRIDPAQSTWTMVELNGHELRQEPAREACFKVVHRDADMHELGGMSEPARRERIHRHMNNEVGSLEIAAQCLVDFPEAPWELRMELARQCWDESRHVRLLYRRLCELGGHKGEFPIANFEWLVTCTLRSLSARLAVQNRTFEAGQMDILARIVDDWRAAGDDRTADMLEGILADEIQHVRFGNQWIRRLAEADRRTLLEVVAGIGFLGQLTRAFAPKPGEVNAVGTPLKAPESQVPMVNVEDRRLAEFTDQEIEEVLRQAGFRSVVPREDRRPSP